MKLLPLILLLCIALAFSAQAQDLKTIVTTYEDKMAKINSWEYDIHYKMKYFSANDTLHFYPNCRLIKHASDSLFGGSFWIKSDSIDRYYDLENIYVIHHNSKKIMRYFAHRGQTWAINGNTIGGVLNSFFLKPNRFTAYLDDSTITSTLHKTSINDQSFTAIEFNFKDDLPVEQMKKTFYFDADMILKNITYSVKLQNEWQYNEWHFSNEKYDAITDEELNEEFNLLAKTYSIEDYKAPDPKSMAPLAIGTTAPNFVGLNFQSNDSVQLNDYKNKIILLDFWYKDCYPCMKAIPFLSRLLAKYGSDNLVVLGLNPFDNKEENKKKLPDFIELNKMTYPCIFIDNHVLESYNVKAFPTFYIIDKQGKIVYAEVGFSEENEENLELLLEELMK